jgi:hypothetical protein
MRGTDEPQLDVFSYVSQEQRMRYLAILATKAKAECGAPGSKENLWSTADVAKPLLQSQNRDAWRESRSVLSLFLQPARQEERSKSSGFIPVNCLRSLDDCIDVRRHQCSIQDRPFVIRGDFATLLSCKHLHKSPISGCCGGELRWIWSDRFPNRELGKDIFACCF